MSLIKSKWQFILFSFLLFIVLILTLYDILFDKNWKIYLILSYIFLFVFFSLIIYFKRKKLLRQIGTIEEFEKSLKGGLFHFKCPTCNGIFAIKKSKRNNKKSVKMCCPDCGAIGLIPPHPICITEVIPEKKSIKANFRCLKCGEGITVWAEGKDLYEDIIVYSCPFCGVKKKLNRI